MNGRAFFDFDGTITRHDSFIRFSIFTLGKKRVLTAFIKSIISIILWKIGIKTNSQAKEVLFFNLFHNYPYDSFKNKCEEFIPIIDSMLREDIMSLINEHRKNGVPVTIVSASVADWIKPWAFKHGIDEIIATEIQIAPSNIILSGRFSTPNCVGENKVKRIKERYPKINLKDCWAYGDSQSDIPMLQAVGHSFKV